MNMLAAYVMIVFGMTIGLYWMGYTSPLLVGLESVTTTGDVATPLMNAIIGIFLNPAFLVLIGVTAVSAYFLGGTGSGVTNLFLVFTLMLMVNFFILPTSFILAAEMNAIFKIFIAGFLNLFVALAIVEFVRG